ncbi:MAG: hypothetical protein IE934_04625 [Sphingopyxis sp.]|nr:hypothetical protein [Sphingopyxis sp.]
MTFASSEFVALVKRARAKFGVGIDEAPEPVFADAKMRRPIAWRINHDPEGRRQALVRGGERGRLPCHRALDSKVQESPAYCALRFGRTDCRTRRARKPNRDRRFPPDGRAG